MNLASLFHGTLGIITIVWVLFIIGLFIYAIIRAFSKTGKIIKDCDSLSFPAGEDVLNKTIVGKMLLENELDQTSDFIEDSVNTSLSPHVAGNGEVIFPYPGYFFARYSSHRPQPSQKRQ